MIKKARSHSDTMRKVQEILNDSLYEIANQLLDLEETVKDLKDESDFKNDFWKIYYG